MSIPAEQHMTSSVPRVQHAIVTSSNCMNSCFSQHIPGQLHGNVPTQSQGTGHCLNAVTAVAQVYVASISKLNSFHMQIKVVPHEMGACYLTAIRHRHILDIMDEV